jgi:hypothetical protein
MNVRDQQLTDVGESDAFPGKFLFERGERRARARIDERNAGRAVQNRGGDDGGTSEEIEVDVIDS